MKSTSCSFRLPIPQPRLTLAAVSLFLLSACEIKTVNESLYLTDNLTLDGNLEKTKIRVDSPGVVIDGKGFVIDGDCNTECIGLVVNADNVTVRDVTIRGFDGGVTINPNVSNTLFENVRIIDNVQHGIFVNIGANRFQCHNCDISDNGTTGIYFEYNTHGNIIKDSLIASNGHRNKDTGDWIRNLRNDSKDKREGIAIDSSQGNVISGTRFVNNALSGVTLYRNCGERGVRREWGANFNEIRNSSFTDGIHIASRQDKDLSTWTCVEPYVYENRYITDEAEYNLIDNIELLGNARILVQDDNNTVDTIRGGTVIVGSRVRKALNQPVTNLTLNNISGPLAEVVDAAGSTQAR